MLAMFYKIFGEYIKMSEVIDLTYYKKIEI